MVESKEKSASTQRMKFNSEAVKTLALKYKCTEYFVRESIKGNKNSDTSEKIRVDYKKLCSEMQELLNKHKK